jgi:rare lipoprotein A
MRSLSVALLGLAALAAAGCGARSTRGAEGPAEASSDSQVSSFRGGVSPSGATVLAAPQKGKATYYSDKLAGRKTASGARYDPKAKTAAHRTLPFGTVIEVSRKDGRWVRVVVNDRGPFTKGRIVDLSRAAAEDIDLIQAGVADVTLWVVEKPAPRPKKD